MGLLSREKQPLQQLHSKKGDGQISELEGGLIFGRLVCIFCVINWLVCICSISLKDAWYIPIENCLPTPLYGMNKVLLMCTDVVVYPNLEYGQNACHWQHR